MPKGLQPNRLLGGSPNSTGVKAYRIANGYATNLANGDPVALSAGTVVKYAQGNQPLGVATAFQWMDSTQKPVFSTSFPAATSSSGLITGDNRPLVFVTDNPNQTYIIDAKVSLAVSAGSIGAIYALSLAAPNMIGGYSNAVLDSIAVSLDQAAVRVIGLVTTPGNAFDVSGNTAEVVLVNHIYNK